MTAKSYSVRVVAWFLAFVSLPVVWWYYPKFLLAWIRLNNAIMTWVVDRGISYIPHPTQRYIRLALKPGEWFQWGLAKALNQVPNAYRDHVEVVVRLRYGDPGTWMVLGQLAVGLAITYYVLHWIRRRRRLRRLRRGPTPRIESMPTL